VAIVGAGVIGMSAAWELSRAGCRVALYDPRPGQGASHAAAGMLAPVSEAAYGEDEVLALGLDSLRRWPAFATELRVASRGVDVGLRTAGTLLVAHDRDDLADLARFADFVARQGEHALRLTSRQARTLEPALSPSLSGAFLIESDHSVDNRAVCRALLAALDHAGVPVHRATVQPHLIDSRAVGVRLPGGDIDEADVVLVAAGAASSALTGVPPGVIPRVRPVKGQILRLHGRARVIHRTVRARVAGVPVYLVPRDGGELVVGATSEDVGTDQLVTAGGVHDLLRAALAVVPEVAELELSECTARLRPAADDNAPLIGATAVPGLIVATGHYRGGVLMAPATAAAVRDLVCGAAHLPAPVPVSASRGAL
jgi:glycine oxidase